LLIRDGAAHDFKQADKTKPLLKSFVFADVFPEVLFVKRLKLGNMFVREPHIYSL